MKNTKPSNKTLQTVSEYAELYRIRGEMTAVYRPTRSVERFMARYGIRASTLKEQVIWCDRLLAEAYDRLYEKVDTQMGF